MSWRDVTGRDLRSAWRARTIPSVALTIGFFTVGMIALQRYLDSGPTPPATEAAVASLSLLLMLFVPIAGLWGAYGAIVTERVTGSVRFLLGLPNSRLDAYAGKYVSRAFVVAASIAVSMLIAAAIVGLTFAEGSFVAIALLGGLAVLYGLVFVGIGLAVSTLFDTESRASTAVVSIFILFRIGWPAIQLAGLRLTETNPSVDGYPLWYFVFGRLNPMNAFMKLTTTVSEYDAEQLITKPEGWEPMVTTVPFALIVLIGWAVVIPVLGYFQFRRMDIL